MRDFYDVHILTTTQVFDADTFRAALIRTVEKRGTTEQMADMTDTIMMIEESSVMLDFWEKYRRKYSYADEVTWEMAIGALKVLAAIVQAEK
jgi:ABC-type branched-subunit amino acid transport system substrate-binding protein